MKQSIGRVSSFIKNVERKIVNEQKIMKVYQVTAILTIVGNGRKVNYTFTIDATDPDDACYMVYNSVPSEFTKNQHEIRVTRIKEVTNKINPIFNNDEFPEKGFEEYDDES